MTCLEEKPHRIRKKLMASETLLEDLTQACLDIQGLIKYYQVEIQELNSELINKEVKITFEQVGNIRGKIEAYTDHITEMTSVLDTLKGIMPE